MVYVTKLVHSEKPLILILKTTNKIKKYFNTFNFFRDNSMGKIISKYQTFA